MVTLTRPAREYIDVDFSFEQHPISKNLLIKKNINSVKQSIINLLSLRGGEKPFHPEIKSPIYEYLFENMSVVVQVVLESEIQKYLLAYEPRIKIENISVSFPNSNAVSVTIEGSLVSLSEPFNVTVLIDRLR